MTDNGFWIYAAVFLLGAAGAWVVARWGERLSLLDYPSARSSHDGVVPRGGGAGILAAFILCALWFGVPAGFWLPAALVSLLSLANDRWEMDVSVRLLVHLVAAGGFLIFHPVPEMSDSPVFFWVALSLFYVVFVAGTANYYNFMDGINGIAAITGMVGFGLLAAYGYVSQKPDHLWWLCLGLVFACAGFMPFNIPRARVFMGDVGSILLGFVFACVVVSFSNSLVDFVVTSSFLFPFYADELFTLLERMKRGAAITRPHRLHLYQVLVNQGGLAHWWVAAGYGLAQLLIGLVVWKAAVVSLFGCLGLLACLLVLFGMVNRALKRRYQTHR